MRRPFSFLSALSILLLGAFSLSQAGCGEPEAASPKSR